MPQAENRDEFVDAWKSHIDQLASLGNSLPDEDLDEFVDLDDWVKKATENSY